MRVKHQYRARLIDRLLAAGPEGVIIAGAQGLSHESLRAARTKLFSLFEQMPQAVPFIADNVMEHLYAVSEREVWSVHKHFASLTPHYPLMWVECARPSKVVSETFGPQSSEGLPTLCGYLVVAQDKAAVNARIDDPATMVKTVKQAVSVLERSDPAAVRAVAGRIRAEGWGKPEAYSDEERMIAQQIAVVESARWPEERDAALRAGVNGVFAANYFMLMDGYLYWLPMDVVFVLDEFGQSVGEPQGGVFIDNKDAFNKDHFTIINPLCLTLSFLNTPGAFEEPGIIPPSDVSQRWQEKNGFPLAACRRINITDVSDHC